MATTLSAQKVSSSNYALKALCRLIGLSCIAGFLVNVFGLVFPPNIANVEWRLEVLQQLGDRSIVLLFGLALCLYGNLDNRAWRKRLVLACLILGVLFNLSCVLVIRDGLTLQSLLTGSLGEKASQAQAQIEQAKSDPKITKKLTAEQLETLSQRVDTQAKSLKQNAQTITIRKIVFSVGNLIVVGLTLIGLGQFGARFPRD